MDILKIDGNPLTLFKTKLYYLLKEIATPYFINIEYLIDSQEKRLYFRNESTTKIPKFKNVYCKIAISINIEPLINSNYTEFCADVAHIIATQKRFNTYQKNKLNRSSNFSLSFLISCHLGLDKIKIKLIKI